MKFLFDLPNEQLLPATIDLVEKIETFLSTTKMSELKTAVTLTTKGVQMASGIFMLW